MSFLHIQQISSFFSKTFKSQIDLSDVTGQTENFFLTRSLAAYAIQHHALVSPQIASDAVVDGSEDNGIDAIYYDSQQNMLYIVQSKWIHNGKGEPDNGDVKKFINGINDLFHFKFDRFNNKTRKKEAIIRKAVEDSKTTYQLILTYTGVNELAIHSKRDFQDLLSELNDSSELVHLSVFNQKRIHSSLVNIDNVDPINEIVQLKQFGKIAEPFVGYYGQINGAELYGWWEKYRKRLFTKNIRSVLGETEVNKEITKTLEEFPEHFWYFNNGITVICDSAVKNMVGGGSTDIGHLKCENMSIVNGAQTVSTIGKFGEQDPARLDNVYVAVRIIAVGSETNFGEKITRSNNTQNRVENRDFVMFDPEQTRIREELLLDGVEYRFSRGIYEITEGISFDLIEATTALSCASLDVSIVVQLKREIGKIWDNLEKSPYKKLFNPTVTGRYVYNCVRLQRLIDQVIKQKEIALSGGRDQSILIHGNRMLALMIFNNIDKSKYSTEIVKFDRPELIEHMQMRVNYQFDSLKIVVDESYENAIVPTLFKNGAKCDDIYKRLKQLNS
ncbi:AIPR family protein [Pedobacter antarcticus]|uniref:AIPR family protein n=1 Tax=Pedobacter antarcticus TaxID=34086 RepID=UPI002931A150|nr:AIPR family protein [Pedobacter antarcticus]